MQTRQSFLERCAALLPDALHATYILDEIGDAYPEIHTAEREYVCALDSHSVIIEKVTALTDDDVIKYLASYIPDAILAEIENDDEDNSLADLDQTKSDAIIDFARRVDPTESNIAAEIRDTIRDNFDIPNLHI